MNNFSKYFVYWNLHKDLWSVQDIKAKKVIAHLPSLVLCDCVFVVREGGRQRVLKEKRKNVHAGVKGHIHNVDLPTTEGLIPLYYNPYTCEYFINYETKEKIINAKYVYFYPNKKVYTDASGN
jgi:hypothetical protein